MANEVERARRRGDRERNSRSKSSSKEKDFDRHSSSSHEEGSSSLKKSGHFSSRNGTNGNGHLVNETHSYNNTSNNYRYRKDSNDYYYSQNQSSYRLALKLRFKLISKLKFKLTFVFTEEENEIITIIRILITTRYRTMLKITTHTVMVKYKL